MKANPQPTIDLGALVQGFVEDLRIVAQADRTDEQPTKGLGQLRQVAEKVRGDQAQAIAQINDLYRQRTEAMQATLAQRQRRLEAYAGRKRQHIPTIPDKFIVAGQVTDQASGNGLPYVRIRAFDLDRRYDDLLGETRTDALGYYRLEYDLADFDELDEKPETYIEVLDDNEEVLFTSTKSFVQKAGQSLFIASVVDGERVPASRRLSKKVAHTVERRQQDLARRHRTLEYRPDVASEIPGGGPVKSSAPSRTKKKSAADAPKGKKGRAKSRTGPKNAAASELAKIKGVGPAYRGRLEEAGIVTASAVAKSKPKKLAEVLGVSESRARKIAADAKKVARKKR